MRVIFVAVYSIMLFMLFACKRHITIDEMRHETHRKLMGRWQLEKKTVEIFDFYPTLVLDSVYMGTTEDYFHFKDNDSVSIGEAGKPIKEEQAYINVTQVVIFSLLLSWSIDSLNNNRLVLSEHVRNDDSTDKSRRETLYFYK